MLLSKHKRSNNQSEVCEFYYLAYLNAVYTVSLGFTDSTREAGGSGAGRAHMSPGDQNGVSAPDKQPAVLTHSHSQTHCFSSGSSRAALSAKALVNHNSTASETCMLTVSADFTPLLLLHSLYSLSLTSSLCLFYTSFYFSSSIYLYIVLFPPFIPLLQTICLYLPL